MIATQNVWTKFILYLYLKVTAVIYVITSYSIHYTKLYDENGGKAKIPTAFDSKLQDLESREKYQSLGSNHASYTNLSTVGFITS